MSVLSFFCTSLSPTATIVATDEHGVALGKPSIASLPCDGQAEIEIEERSPAEVTHLWGRGDSGELLRVQLTPDGTHAVNPGFDVTPARLVTALSEHGVTDASETGLARWCVFASLT